MFWDCLKNLSTGLGIVRRNVHRTNAVATIDMAYSVFESSGTDKTLPPLIIMHGLFGSKQNWRGIGRALESKTNRKIITVDARNHGDSPHTDEHSYVNMSADVIQLMRKMDINKCCLMGHSMGGRCIMYTALHHPELIERGIVVDISPLTVPRDFSLMEQIFIGMKKLNVPKHLSMAEGRAYAQHELNRTIDSKGTVDFILLNLRKGSDGIFYWAHNVDGLHKNFTKMAEFADHIKDMPPFNGQIAFICGKLSNFVDSDSWPEIQKIFPNSEIHWLDAGHLVHFDKPAEFLEIVTNFLKS